MPNQRDPTKKLVGVWLTPAEIAKMDEICRAYRCNRSDLIKSLALNQPFPKKLRTKYNKQNE